MKDDDLTPESSKRIVSKQLAVWVSGVIVITVLITVNYLIEIFDDYIR